METQTQLSVQFLDKAISIDSSSDEAWNKKGEIYGRVFNDLEKSEQYLLKAYAISPNNVSVLENLGVLYGISGKLEESKKYLLKATNIAPNNRQIKLNLAQTYTLLGMPDSAAYYQTK